MAQQPEIIVKKDPKLTIAIIGLIATILFVAFCERQDKYLPAPLPDTNDSTFNKRADSIKVGKVKDDSLENVRVETVIKYKYIRQDVINNIHDTTVVLRFVCVADSLINNDTIQLSNLRSNNRMLTDQLDYKEKDNLRLKTENDSLKFVGKNYKRGFKHGFLTGALVGNVVTVGIVAAQAKLP